MFLSRQEIVDLPFFRLRELITTASDSVGKVLASTGDRQSIACAIFGPSPAQHCHQPHTRTSSRKRRYRVSLLMGTLHRMKPSSV